LSLDLGNPQYPGVFANLYADEVYRGSQVRGHALKGIDAMDSGDHMFFENTGYMMTQYRVYVYSYELSFSVDREIQ